MSSSPTPRAVTPDADLVARAQAGQYEAFEQLADRHAAALYALGMRILRKPHDAEDLVQCTMLKALENLNGFRGDAEFGTWLKRIAVNLALTQLRKQKRWASIVQSDDGPLPLPERIVDWRADVEQQVQRREVRQRLDEAVDSLDEKYRLVFVLRDIEQLSVKQTAEQLELTESNVKVRLMRARLMLREKLTDLFGVGPELKPSHAGPLTESDREGGT